MYVYKLWVLVLPFQDMKHHLMAATHVRAHTHMHTHTRTQTPVPAAELQQLRWQQLAHHVGLEVGVAQKGAWCGDCCPC